MPAVVMNLFYTGLGIARSLGEQGVPVIGLTAHRDAPGNVSRYVRAVRCADSSAEPEMLGNQLVDLGRSIGRRSVLFPTRDSDVVVLDRFRSELQTYFHLVLPPAGALATCLNKWATFQAAIEHGVPTPRSWLVQNHADLHRAAAGARYPCILKPLEAHHWRTATNWELVGHRKAICVESAEQLLAEYSNIASVEPRALVQELIPGGDEHLLIAACYVDQHGEYQDGFTIQKLLQLPAGFGTGCIVQSVNRPELLDCTRQLLGAISFSGIAEVEYKWDGRDESYKLIEINPRPWDQHRLGAAIGSDLVVCAYRDFAGLDRPAAQRRQAERKWIAEDTFAIAALRLLRHGAGGLRTLIRQARGNRVFAVCSFRDPLPAVVMVTTLVKSLLGGAVRRVFRVGEAMPTREKPAAASATGRRGS